MSQYPIFQVPDEAWAPEQLGTKYKFWYLDGERRFLFKQGRQGTGENWAEKVACELAELLCIPHAHYDLAQWRNCEGVITPSLVSKGARLVLGNEILRRPVEARKYGNSHHTILRVMTVMRSGILKPSCHVGMDTALTASNVFIGVSHA